MEEWTIVLSSIQPFIHSIMTHYAGLALLGLVVGAFGTLIGAGGGFVLVPALLLFYPDESPAVITSISLAVVFFNAAAGTISYARLRRIDYVSGLMFAAAAMPGAILGALTTTVLSRRAFDLLFGTIVILAAGGMLWKPGGPALMPFSDRFRHRSCALTDAEGTTHRYAYPLAPGLAICFGAGYLSSLVGIGGGIIHVPMMIRMLGFPVHVATATSHFVLTGMSLTMTDGSTGCF